MGGGLLKGRGAPQRERAPQGEGGPLKGREAHLRGGGPPQGEGGPHKGRGPPQSISPRAPDGLGPAQVLTEFI